MHPVDPTISKTVQHALDRISSLDDRKALIQFYKNATRYEEITEMERELVIDAIENQLRTVSPGAATKVFGPKDSEGREYLERIYADLAQEFDLTGNIVKNGVKTGGDMIAGRMHIDVYVSYKNAGGWHTTLSWLQETPGTQRYLRVAVYHGGISNITSYSEDLFEVEQEENAVAKYRDHLRALTA